MLLIQRKSKTPTVQHYLLYLCYLWSYIALALSIHSASCFKLLLTRHILMPDYNLSFAPIFCLLF